jgi:RNA polymerase sigma-70 factor, ECF subfamily
VHRSNSQLLQATINNLPVQYREALLLREVEEMSYQEMGEILSIPIGTVMSRLARARKALKHCIWQVVHHLLRNEHRPNVRP